MMKYLAICLSLFMTLSVYADVLPRVEIETNMGNIVLELYPAKAPRTVKNFIQSIQEGFYEETIFHRVIPKFIMQGGGYNSQFEKKPTGNAIVNEADNSLKNLRGTVAMAHHTDDPNSATTQFFINIADNPSLDYSSSITTKSWGYAVFGKVTEGMEVVDKIAKVKTGQGGEFSKNVPITPVIIKKMTVSDIPTNLDELEAIETPKTPLIDKVGMTGDMANSKTTDDSSDDESDAESDDDVDEDDAEDVNWDDDEDDIDNEAGDEEVADTESDSSKKVPAHKNNEPQPAPDAPSKPDTPEPLSE